MPLLFRSSLLLRSLVLYIEVYLKLNLHGVTKKRRRSAVSGVRSDGRDIKRGHQEVLQQLGGGMTSRITVTRTEKRYVWSQKAGTQRAPSG
jgi:ABC-type taurine transport system ATPase subunit